LGLAVSYEEESFKALTINVNLTSLFSFTTDNEVK
jgi:hypothetical protein